LAVIKLSQISEPFKQCGAQLIRHTTPTPIPRRDARYIHSRLGSEAQQILQGRNGKIGHRSPGNSHEGAYRIFVNVLFISTQELPFFFGDRVPPT
jgi:hypothetical protein